MMLQRKDAECRKYRKWFTHYRGNLFQLPARYIKCDITNTISVLECSNNIVFTRCSFTMLLSAVVDMDRENWPDSMIPPDRSYGCAEKLDRDGGARQI